MKVKEETFQTPTHGRVLAQVLKRDNGDPMWMDQPKLVAAFDGIYFDGSWPTLQLADLLTLYQMLQRAEDAHILLSRGSAVEAVGC